MLSKNFAGAGSRGLALALFFLLAAPSAFALSFSSDFLHIYSDKSGASFAWSADLSHSLSLKNSSLSLGASYKGAASTLENVSGKGCFFDFFVDFEGKFLGARGAAFFSIANDALICISGDNYSTEKMRLFGGDFSFPVKIRGFSLEPFFLLSSLSCENGDFHYFFADPKAPLFYSAGAKFSFKNFSLSGLYASGALDFFTDFSLSDKRIIEGALNGFGFFAKNRFCLKNFSITPALGFLHMNARAKGRLSAKSQPYMFFPYSIFNFAGSAKIDAVFLGVGSSFFKSVFSFEIDADSVFCLNQTGAWAANYLYKKNLFFDGSQGSISGTFDFLKFNGLLFLRLAANFSPSLKKCAMDFFIKKTFPIPLFFNETFPNLFDIIKQNENFVLDYLLCGLSVGVRLSI